MYGTATPGLPVAPPIPQAPMAPVMSDPMFGVNPYATGSTYPGSLTNSGGINGPASTVVNSLGQTVPAPGEQSPEELQANILAGIAKLQTVNPELAAQYATQYGGPEAPQDEGGLLGAIKDIGGAILGGAGKIVDLLGRTAHIVPAMLKNDDDPWYEDIGQALTGKDQTNWNALFQEWGWKGDGITGIARAALGFVGDVATDPLTYVFGAAAGVGAAEKASAAGKTAFMTFAGREVALEGGETLSVTKPMLEQVWSAMSGQGSNIGKQLGTASLDGQAETILAGLYGRAIEDAHVSLFKDAFEAAGTAYNLQNARRLAPLLRKGGTMELSSGAKVEYSAMKELLDASVKAGAGQAAKSTEWKVAKEASSILGGIRITPYIPFTQFRYLGPIIPGTNIVRPIAAVARFGAGASVMKRAENLVRNGEADIGDFATLARAGWNGLREGDLATPATKAFADKIAQNGTVRSGFYKASESMGKLTAAITPGASQFRRGLGYYFMESRLKAMKSTIKDIQDNLMYDVIHTYKNEATQGAAAGGRKQKLYQLLESEWGISKRARHNTATTEQRDALYNFMDLFAGADDIPTSAADVAQGRLDDWFWRQPENAEVLRRGGAMTDAPIGLEPGAADLAKAEARLAKMKEVLQQVPEGPKREVAQQLGMVQRRGMELMREHGIIVRDLRYQDLSKTGVIAFEDRSIFEGGTNLGIKAGAKGGPGAVDGQFYIERPTSKEGPLHADLKGHEDLGIAGIRVTSHPENAAEAVPVAINTERTLIVGQGAAKSDEGKFLAGAVTDEPIVAQAQAEARAKLQSIKDKYLEQNPNMPIPNGAPIADDTFEQTVAQLTSELLANRGGFGYDSILYRHEDGTVDLVLLGTKEVGAEEQLKYLSHAAPRAKTSAGYAPRGFTHEASQYLSGHAGIVHAVADLEAKATRKTVGMTLDEAEAEAKAVIMKELEQREAPQDVLDHVAAMQLFERDPLKAHDDYVTRVTNTVASSIMGEMGERMNVLGGHLPAMFGGLATIETARLGADDATVALLARVGGPETVRAAERIKKNERALLDATTLQNSRESERIAQLLDRWQAGEDVDLTELADNNPQMARLVKAATDFGEAIQQERVKTLKHMDRWRGREEDLRKVMQQMEDDSLVPPETAWSDPLKNNWAHRTGAMKRAEVEKYINPAMERAPRADGQGVGLKSNDEYAALKESIRRDGMREPIIIDYDPVSGKAIVSEGYHRLLIAKELGLDDVPVMFYRTHPDSIDSAAKLLEMEGGKPLRLPREYMATDSSAVNFGPWGIVPSQWSPRQLQGLPEVSRADLEELLRNGELGLGKDGTILTRKGAARRAGVGGAKRVYSRAEIDAALDDGTRTLKDLDTYQAGGIPQVAKPQHAPNEDLQLLAEGYMQAQGKEIDQRARGAYAEVNEKRAKAIAAAYEAGAHDPHNPAVAASYDAFKKETLRQWDWLEAHGYHMEPWTGEGQPYANSEEFLADIRDHKHLYYFTGGDLPVDHPLADMANRASGDHANTFNDIFRAVHDIFGHGQKGLSTGPRGEENAWRSHALMYSDEARPAMTTETRGQNSWVNFGPQAEGVPLKDRPFAEQKAFLLPEEMSTITTPLAPIAERRGSQVAAAAKALGQQVERESTRTAKTATRDADKVARLSRNLREAEMAMNDITDRKEELVAKLRPAIVTEGDKPWEKSGMQALTIPGLQGMWMHTYMAQELEHQLKGKPVTAIRDAWKSWVLNPWKKWATYRSPGFHVRNAMGAWFNNFLGGVTHEDYAFAQRIMSAREGGKWATRQLESKDFARMNMGKVAGLAEMDGKLTYGDMADMMSDMGMTRGNAAAVAMVGDAADYRHGDVKSRALRGPRWADDNLRRASSTIEDYFRTAAWATGMGATGGDVYGARAFVMMRHGDYGDLTPTEEFIKDVVPFYKWMRTNVPYQMRMMVEQPGKLLAIQKLQRSVYDAAGLDADEYMKSTPDWMQQSLNIPLPWTKDGDSPVDVLSLNLPYGDLYKGTREYLSSFLPVVSPLIESFVTHKSTFTGQELGVKMVPLAGWMNLPGIKQLVTAFPGAQTGPDGQVYISDTLDNVLNAVPVYSRFRNWTSGDPNRVEHRMGALTSFFVGAGVRGVDLNADELAFYYDTLEPTLKMYQSMGVTFPTKEQLQAAGLLATAPGPSADSLYPMQAA